MNTQTDLLPVQLICMGSACIFWAISLICWHIPMFSFICLDHWPVAVRFCQSFAACQQMRWITVFSVLNLFKFRGICGADGKQIMLFFLCCLPQLQVYSGEIVTGPSTTSKVTFWLCETVIGGGRKGSPPEHRIWTCAIGHATWTPTKIFHLYGEKQLSNEGSNYAGPFRPIDYVGVFRGLSHKNGEIWP